MIIKLNQKEYADRIGVKQPSVSYRINNNMPLPGVKKVEQFSRFYVLHFDTKTNIPRAKKMFKEKLPISK